MFKKINSEAKMPEIRFFFDQALVLNKFTKVCSSPFGVSQGQCMNEVSQNKS